MIGLSAIPLMLMLSDLGPTGARDRWLAVGVSACCIAMASMWLRSKWPTRLQSQLCVGVGSILIAVACLIEANPPSA